MACIFGLMGNSTPPNDIHGNAMSRININSTYTTIMNWSLNFCIGPLERGLAEYGVDDEHQAVLLPVPKELAMFVDEYSAGGMKFCKN